MSPTDLGSVPAHTARRALLAAQGLTAAPGARAATPAGLLAAIRRMHSLQIDTISVVARSPYLVLWSRVGDYDPAALEGLLAGHRIFEYWSHAACFLHADDWPAYRSVMLHGRPSHPWRATWMANHRELVTAVLDRVRTEGPLRSADFERPDHKSGGWWDWKEEKIALELLFDRGDLTVTRRDRFQRVYDLPERVFPDWSDASIPTLDEAHAALIRGAVRALGIARPEWVQNYLYTTWMKRVRVRTLMQQLAADGELLTCSVEGWKEPGYVHPENAALVESAATGRRPRTRTAILSPFDPVTWDRARASELFGFDYRIECYTPAPKRQYGYFTLPILHGDALVGRLDPKAHRKLGVFEVKALHLEPGTQITAALVDGLRDTLRRMAAWHGTPEVVVRHSPAPGLADALNG